MTVSVAYHDLLSAEAPVLPVAPALLYADVPFGTGRSFSTFKDDMATALHVTHAVVEKSRALALGGVLVIHCDHRINFLARALMEDAPHLTFLNEIVWAYNSGGAGKKCVPQKHDTLIVYAEASREPTFHVLREPYPRDYKDRPGFHPEGRMQTSVWNVPILSTTSTERTGYPTEKPPALLERLLRTYTNEGDWVWDACCGSGSMGVEASRTGRNAFLTDIHPEALRTATDRNKNFIAGVDTCQPRG
jgi:site-specific DNA-methyltransferase (adenine-specific)